MSSPSRPLPCDAVVCSSGAATGPIRLPEKDSQLFIEAFNRLYRSAGLSIAGPNPAAAAAPSPKDQDATADRHR